MPAIVIGRRACVPKTTALAPHEAAFVLRCSEREVRNMLRRGERYASRGQDAEGIVAQGALPVALVGGRRRADIAVVARLAAHDDLALAALAAIVERRLHVPRAASADDPAPDLVTVISRL